MGRNSVQSHFVLDLAPRRLKLAPTQLPILANYALGRPLHSLRHPWLAAYLRRSLRIAANTFVQKLQATLNLFD